MLTVCQQFYGRFLNIDTASSAANTIIAIIMNSASGMKYVSAIEAGVAVGAAVAVGASITVKPSSEYDGQ